MKYFFFLCFLCFFIIFLYVCNKDTYTKPVLYKNFFKRTEIDYIFKLSNKVGFKESKVSNSHILDTRVRKSHTCWIPINYTTKLFGIIEKISKFLNVDVKNMEQLQVLKYNKHGFYKPHQDAHCCGPSKLNESNPRVLTCIIGLSDSSEFSNGETIFPNLNMSFKLNKGDLLVFNNFDNNGKCTDLSIHGGSPVTSGNKYIANLWIHKHPF